VFITTSKPLAASSIVPVLLGEPCCWAKRLPRREAISAVVGWGAKASGLRAEALAATHQLPCYRLEDGFLRSFRPGAASPGLSLVVDTQGIYYDATRPSDLEVLLASKKDVLEGLEVQVAQAIELMLTHELSKYNHAPPLPVACLRKDDHSRVLVVDQTHGDVSVRLGMSSEQTFHEMVDAALEENPQATIYIKTHPEVSNGSKQGYLSQWPSHPRIVMLREVANPINLLTYVDSVYVVSSTFGFEALLANKSVAVFGLPWYAGWGVTDDRQYCQRRVRTRSVKELFASAYFHYTRYLNPETHQPGDIFDVIRWLVQQKIEETRLSGHIIGVGFRDWKAANLAPLLSISPDRVVFANDPKEAHALSITAGDSVVAWGRDAPEGVEALIANSGAKRWRLEDGFVRSVGLGAHMVPPLSIVLDAEGIYFDPSQPSTLEHLLSTTAFSPGDCTRARCVRELIVEYGLTKYNVERRQQPSWVDSGNEVILVPGQVEDDASIRYGTTVVSTNLALLKAAREAHPSAFIVYKPHPDVLYAKRKGNIATARQWADHIETKCSVVSCLEHCDVVHTMTSLAGFEALLRGKRVVTYGEPFYAGWGLTEDHVTQGKALHRRRRALTLDELVAGTLLHYPRYWDPVLKGYTTCESVLRHIISQRAAQEASGQLGGLKLGYWRRQLRKWKIIRRSK
jgi:capsular polysaccharide export protein